MGQTEYYKKAIDKNGNIKIYTYTYSSQKYYKNRGVDKVECDVCHRMVYPSYLAEHKTKKTCRPQTHIQIIPNPN
jgi:hypothetical protein